MGEYISYFLLHPRRFGEVYDPTVDDMLQHPFYSAQLWNNNFEFTDIIHPGDTFMLEYIMKNKSIMKNKPEFQAYIYRLKDVLNTKLKMREGMRSVAYYFKFRSKTMKHSDYKVGHTEMEPPIFVQNSLSEDTEKTTQNSLSKKTDNSKTNKNKISCCDIV